jgi:hypothetical protein
VTADSSPNSKNPSICVWERRPRREGEGANGGRTTPSTFTVVLISVLVVLLIQNWSAVEVVVKPWVSSMFEESKRRAALNEVLKRVERIMEDVGVDEDV